MAKNRNRTPSSSILVVYPRLEQDKCVSPLVHSQHRLDFMVGGGAHDQWEINFNYVVFKQKEKKRNLLEQNENEGADFPRFIVIESLEEVCLVKFFPFLIEKVILRRATHQNVMKTRNGNLLVEVNSWRQAENILKMKSFHTTKCRADVHERLNTSKGVIKSRELVLATAEAIIAALTKQGVINIRKIAVSKGKEQIETKTYNMSQNPGGASNAQNMDTTGRLAEDETCAKCSEKDPGYVEDDCLKGIRCVNCR